jgi:hypothetical protein
VKNVRPNEANRLNQRRAILRLWIGALVPLAAWGLHSALVGVLASVPCTPALVYWLYGITALALLGVGFGAYVSIRLLRLAKDAADRAELAVKRTRFFAITGVLLSALFAYAIVRDALVVAEHLVC